MEIAKAILSHFFKRGKPQTRLRDVKTGRFISGKMVRVTVGTGISVHSKRRRYTETETVPFSMVKETEEKLIEKLYSKVEQDIDYDLDEWYPTPKIEVGTEALEIENGDFR